MIMCQFKDSFPVCEFFPMMQCLWGVVGQEVEGKFGVMEVELLDDFKAEEGVEFD